MKINLFLQKMSGFAFIILFSCTTGPLQSAKEREMDKHTIDEKSSLNFAQVKSTCQRIGTQDSMMISFSNTTDCKKSLEEWLSFKKKISSEMRDYYNEIRSCSIEESKNQSSLVLKCNELPGIFSFYQKPKNVNPQEFHENCVLLRQDGLSRTKNNSYLPEEMIVLHFEKSDGCEKKMEQAFSEDWKGLIEQRCFLVKGIYFETLLSCKGKLPPELAYYETQDAINQAYAKAVIKNCQVQGSASTKTIRFQNNDDCQQVMEQARDWKKWKEWVEKECLFTKKQAEGTLVLHCKQGLPKGLEMYQTKHLNHPEIVTEVQKRCKFASGLYFDGIRFVFSLACQDALYLAVDQHPDFLSCQVGSQWGLLTLSCKNGLPSLFDDYKSQERKNLAYQTGISTQCHRLGVMNAKKLVLMNEPYCLQILQEALRDDWKPLTKNQCDSLEKRGDSIELICEKGLPKEIKDPFQVQESKLIPN